jgi:hypothetical protein
MDKKDKKDKKDDTKGDEKPVAPDEYQMAFELRPQQCKFSSL